MLLELKNRSSKPAPELLNEYSRKVDFLKGLLEAEKLSSSTEKALANQFLAPGRTPTTAKERAPATKTVHLRTKARCTDNMRSELLGTDPVSINDSEEPNVRKRKGLEPDEKQSATELDAVLQHHQNLQEKLAEEMLSLARSLKNNTLAAQNVIKQDNQTLSQSLRMADHNFEKLKDESERLEQHAKKSVNWLLWIMLIIVLEARLGSLQMYQLQRVGKRQKEPWRARCRACCSEFMLLQVDSRWCPGKNRAQLVSLSCTGLTRKTSLTKDTD
ncbi:vesicle transport protein USE1 isoform X1 [Alligator sinensis]|uniref:Vesicle transport protein USE1 n=1 Tax=Alligator sinensis TaxID=38654 RepID=A0A3Q0FXD5_ALLSI|nr:vesicle transport protein USE1 isoform X1 [Alligator sinensis]